MPEATPSDTRSEQEPLRWSTAAIALLFVAAIAAGGAFSALVRYDLVGFGHLPRAAVFGVFLLLLLNGAAMKLRRRRQTSARGKDT